MAKERVERDEEDLVRLYLTDIGQYPLLTKDDEVRLAQMIEKGAAARTELDEDEKPTAARKRELRRHVRSATMLNAPSCSRTCDLSCPLPRSIRPRVSPCST